MGLIVQLQAASEAETKDRLQEVNDLRGVVKTIATKLSECENEVEKLDAISEKDDALATEIEAMKKFLERVEVNCIKRYPGNEKITNMIRTDIEKQLQPVHSALTS